MLPNIRPYRHPPSCPFPLCRATMRRAFLRVVNAPHAKSLHAIQDPAYYTVKIRACSLPFLSDTMQAFAEGNANKVPAATAVGS
jgi:hypothetical protein